MLSVFGGGELALPVIIRSEAACVSVAPFVATGGRGPPVTAVGPLGGSEATSFDVKRFKTNAR